MTSRLYDNCLADAQAAIGGRAGRTAGAGFDWSIILSIVQAIIAALSKKAAEAVAPGAASLTPEQEAKARALVGERFRSCCDDLMPALEALCEPLA